ncbi:hypothetical protein GCM10009737_07860 [Nocardioides lentus]|uniref:Helix-turn-helix domain-containing protein n=1 Tax=Nocardioides lentus TaxID=338077 RepID=A0ABP5AC59_9ACTN
MTARTRTAQEAADDLRCSRRKVTETARVLGVGMNLGGRAGWRFTEADLERMRTALTPAPDPELPARRRRRRRGARRTQVTA